MRTESLPFHRIYAQVNTFEFIYSRVYVSLYKNEKSGHYQKRGRVTNEDRQHEKGTCRQKILVVKLHPEEDFSRRSAAVRLHRRWYNKRRDHCYSRRSYRLE